MPKHTLTGNIKLHRAFHSRFLGNRRDVLVYLPPGYSRFSSRRYPVLYMNDGQNVFDAATSFAGVEWGMDEAAQRQEISNEAGRGIYRARWIVARRFGHTSDWNFLFRGVHTSNCDVAID